MLDIFQGKEVRRARFLTTWQSIINSAQSEIPSNLPSLHKNDALFFIEEWNTQYDHASGQQKIGLAVLASQLQIHRYAKGMLVDGKEDVRLMGIQLLGNLHDETLWDFLCSLANLDNQKISVAAFDALFKINNRRAFDEIMLTLVKRTDWPIDEVVQALRNINTVDVCYFLKQARNNSNADKGQIETYLEEFDCRF